MAKGSQMFGRNIKAENSLRYQGRVNIKDCNGAYHSKSVFGSTKEEVLKKMSILKSSNR